AISDASAADTRGFRHAVEFRTSRKADSHRFTINRVGLRYRSSRFRVAQRQALMDWVEERLSPSSARHSRTSQRYPACSYSDFLKFGEPQHGVSPAAMYVCSLAVCSVPRLPRATEQTATRVVSPMTLHRRCPHLRHFACHVVAFLMRV